MAKAHEDKVMEATAMADSNKAVAEGERARRELAKVFKGQKKVPVSIPPLYKPYFGRVMTVFLNGVSIAIPCDGKTYEVPASFAEEIQIRIDNQNELIQKKSKLSDVSNNFETSPGALNLF